MSAVTPPRTSTANAPDPREQLVLPRRQNPKARRRFLRRRLALAGGLLAAALLITAAVLVVASGSAEAPPASGAANVVPADALAYVHLSTDPRRPAVAQSRATAARFPDWPLLATAALSRFDSIAGGSSSIDFATAIRPWLGKEAALALLPTAADSVQPMVVLDVARPVQARAFVAGAGTTPAGAYDGVRLLAYPSGTELAFVGGHYLVAGPDAGLRAAIDAARGRAPSLAHDRAYQRAAASEPADRVLDAYLPEVGIRQLLASRTGVEGALGVLLDRPALKAAAISLSPVAGGARLLVHSVLGTSAARATSFRPTLPSVLPSGSALMLDVAGLDRAAPGLLRATATAGIAGNVGPLLRRLGAALTSQGVNLHSVISLFSGETALAVSPGPTPGLTIVSHVRDESAARAELAALEAPLTALFSGSDSTALQVPELSDHQVGNATVHELQLGPGLQLDFGVFNGLVAVSTSVAAIDVVAQHSRSLAGDAAYRAALADRPAQLSSLLFGDFTRLLQLGEQTGLTSGARVRELLPDLAKIRAIGVSSTSRGTDTTTELRIEIP